MAERKKSDADFLKQARDRWKLAESAAEAQRKREIEDLRFYAGQQWDDDLLTARRGKTLGSGANQQIVPARPSLTINKTLEPVRQVLNQERQADLGYELVPADDFGGVSGPVDHTEIDLREGLVRRIQRDSEAEDARTWAFQRAAIAGQGYRVVMTRYLPGKRADQEIYIERIYNQNSVMIDPAIEQPDASDMNWGFYGTDMLWDAFKAEYPDSKTSATDYNDDQWTALGAQMPGWFRMDTTGKERNRVLRVVNYYYCERESTTLYHLKDGRAVDEDEKDDVDPQLFERDDDNEIVTHTQTKRVVKWAKITGEEVLERTDWPGQWIPIIREVGEELQPYDAERRAQGVVRPMRDSCKANNYLLSKLAEQIGLTPIPPWIMAGGQDTGYEAEWNAATTRTIGVLHYNQKDSFNQPVPQPPQRTQAGTDVSGIATGVQMFGQAIQATSVVPETALGNTDPTVKSGKLARALIEQAEMGTSNFMDNHKRSLRHEARVVNDLLYPIYGRPGRMVQIVNGQGQREALIIGQAFTQQGDGKTKRPVPVPGWQQGQPVPEGAKLYQLSPDADFNIAIRISKKIDTRRQQIAGFLSELIAASPEQMGIIGDKLWEYLDVPDHQEMMERYRVMLLPPIQELLSGNSPLPPAAQQKIAALQAQIEEMTPLADKNKADLIKAQGMEQEETRRKAAELQSREKIEFRKLEVQLEIEGMKIANAQMTARAEQETQQLHAHNDRQMAMQEAAAQREADMAAQAREQQAAQGLSAQEHGQSMEQASQAQQFARENQLNQAADQMTLADQGHQQALEQQANQPQPTGV